MQADSHVARGSPKNHGTHDPGQTGPRAPGYGEAMTLSALGPLLTARSHSQLLSRRRAATATALVRAFAMLFAALTLGWIVVDAMVFGPTLWLRLALVRTVASAAFVALAILSWSPQDTLPAARLRLAALFAIPAAFFIATRTMLLDVPHGSMAEGIAVLYSFVPFVLAAGIAAFPLVATESAALLLLAVALQGWALSRGGADAHLEPFDAAWLLLLIAGVATFAATNQIRLMAALIAQATRDPLTACLRRESGRELLELQFLLSTRRGMPFAVLFADLDRFKDVNDAWGHEAGDGVLATAAAALREASRGSDAVLRWGGEEFVVILPDASAEDALGVVERLREHGAGRRPDGRRITISIGIAERIADGMTDAGALVDLADRRMYLAKQAGRNRCVYCASGEARLILAAED